MADPKYVYVSSGTKTIKSETSDVYLVYSSGNLIVSSGGVAQVFVGYDLNKSGGYVEVRNGGRVHSGSVENGGSLVVSEGGNVYNFIFGIGGNATLKKGAYCNSGRVGSGVNLYASGAEVNNTEVKLGGCLYLYADSTGGVVTPGTAGFTYVSSGGTMYVGSKVSAYYNSISAGALAVVYGMVRSNFVGGNLIISSGGSADESFVSSGGYIYFSPSTTALMVTPQSMVR